MFGLKSLQNGQSGQLLGDGILHIGNVGLSSVPLPCTQYITNTYHEYVCTPKPQPIPPLLDQILAEREIKLANCLGISGCEEGKLARKNHLGQRASTI